MNKGKLVLAIQLALLPLTTFNVVAETAANNGDEQAIETLTNPAGNAAVRQRFNGSAHC